MGLLKALVTEIPKADRGTLLLMSHRNRSVDDDVRKGLKILPPDTFCRVGRLPADDPDLGGVSMEDTRQTALQDPQYQLAMTGLLDKKEILRAKGKARTTLARLMPAPSDFYDERILNRIKRAEMQEVHDLTRRGDPGEAIDAWLCHPPADLAPRWAPLSTLRRSCQDDSERLREVRARFVEILGTRDYTELPWGPELQTLSETLHDFHRDVSTEQTTVDALLLSTRDVAAYTLTSANINFRTLCALRPRIAIIEEAAEVLEPLLTACLPPSVEHLILLGDHQQLAPRVEARVPKKNGLGTSTMQRLVAAGINYAILRQQNRMSFGISELLKEWYPFLEDGPSTRRAEPLRSMPSGPFLWTHTGPESGRYSNKTEVRMILFLAGVLVQTGLSVADIALLTPYKQQVLALTTGLKKYGLAECLSGVHLGTVDSFQGEERKVILVSLVRSNSRGRLGFISDDNRKGVLLSRAQVALYLVGNRETLCSADNWAGTLRCLDGSGRARDAVPVWCRVHPAETAPATVHYIKEADVDEQLLSLCQEKLPCLCCSLGPRALAASTLPAPMMPDRLLEVRSEDCAGEDKNG